MKNSTNLVKICSQQKSENNSIKHVKRQWTMEEKEYLRTKYQILPLHEIAETLNRSIGSIHIKASIEGVSKKKRFWSIGEIAFLIDHHHEMTDRMIAEKLNRNIHVIETQKRIFGLTNPQYLKYWSKDEMIFLRENVHKLTYRIIAEKLGRSVISVTHKIGRLGLVPHRDKYKLKVKEK